jgi:L-amino acid N-acyltransferase YncA
LAVSDRVLTPEDAIATIRALRPARPSPPPAVQAVLCHQLNASDPIFHSLRVDYGGFDTWLARCQREHRPAFLIESSHRHAGIAILKREELPEHGLRGKVLKICTFKVAEDARGYRYGELLLKAIFEYVVSNAFEKAFLTCFPRQHELRRFLALFGFLEHAQTTDGELLLVKRFDPTDEERQQLAPLEFHVKFGPKEISLSGAAVYVVPIQPQFHSALFPDLEQQRWLIVGQTVFGNALLKAYLCNSSVKTIAPGSVLLFYRSHDSCSIRSVGVVDACLRSTEASEIARFVGQRTVYTLDEIQQMCRSETLAILFRQSRTIPRVELDDLIEHNVLRAAPQQITNVRPEGMAWIRQLLAV